MYICTQLFKNYFHVTVTENSPFNSMTAALNNQRASNSSDYFTNSKLFL